MGCRHSQHTNHGLVVCDGACTSCDGCRDAKHKQCADISHRHSERWVLATGQTGRVLNTVFRTFRGDSLRVARKDRILSDVKLMREPSGVRKQLRKGHFCSRNSAQHCVSRICCRSNIYTFCFKKKMHLPLCRGQCRGSETPQRCAAHRHHTPPPAGF